MVAGVSDDDGASAAANARGAGGFGDGRVRLLRDAAAPRAIASTALRFVLGGASSVRHVPTPGFVIAVEPAPRGEGSEAGAAFCAEVRGFDAVTRALERGEAAAARLVLATLDVEAAPWLAAWSEDDQAVERTLRVTRLADGVAVVVVATLAIFGRGVDTALAVTCPAARRPPRPPLDSGVFLQAT